MKGKPPPFLKKGALKPPPAKGKKATPVAPDSEFGPPAKAPGRGKGPKPPPFGY